MTARRRTRRAAAVRALRRAARALLHAHDDAYDEAGLWRFAPGLGPTAPLFAPRTAAERRPRGAGAGGGP